MTPLKTQQKLDYLTDTKTIVGYGSQVTDTIVDGSTINGKIATLSGSFIATGLVSSGKGQIVINGTGIGGYIDTTSTSGTSVTLDTLASNSDQQFYMRVDTISKTIIGNFSQGNSGGAQGIKHFSFHYTTLTNIQGITKGDGSSRYMTLTTTIQLNR